jgi:hypothetical protein
LWVFFSASLSLTSLCPSLSQLSLLVAGLDLPCSFFLLFFLFLLPFFILPASPRLNEKNLVFWFYTSEITMLLLFRKRETTEGCDRWGHNVYVVSISYLQVKNLIAGTVN